MHPETRNGSGCPPAFFVPILKSRGAVHVSDVDNRDTEKGQDELRPYLAANFLTHLLMVLDYNNEPCGFWPYDFPPIRPSQT